MIFFQFVLGLLIAFAAVHHGDAVPVKRQSGGLLVGTGIADITGPIGEVVMMGYAVLGQRANGIHLRLKARAFMFAAPDLPNRRVVFVSADIGSPSHRVRELVLQNLRTKLAPAEAQLYSLDNIMISSTHTHSAPGGYNDDFLYQVPTFGVTPGEREAIASGIADAIISAHKTFAPSTATLSRGDLANASINRSLQSYLNNPEEERARYADNVDRAMVALSIKDGQQLKAAVNWFAVHPVSMKATNLLVSGDNKGYASYLWEFEQKKQGNPSFIAAFGQTNAGDVSPNLQGPRCTDTGAPCDGGKDSCGGDITKCIAHGPGYEEGGDFRSTEIIGERQFLKAKELASAQGIELSGGVVDYRHAWIEMPAVTLADGKGQLCEPAMGYSFSAGTTDQPGAGISWQGDNDPNGSNKWMNFVRNLLRKPSQQLEKCHAPKVILLATGEMDTPYDWQPHQLPVQMFLVTRKLAIIGFPAEITTMSGRRLREAVKAQLVADKSMDEDAEVVIAGLSNLYSSYVTTFEEYQVQRYEAGSTAYGPNTLAGYIQIFKTLAQSFTNSSVPGRSPQFPITTAPRPRQDMNLLTPVVLDTAPLGKRFGDVQKQPAATYRKGDVVTSEFICAHPRNGASDEGMIGNVQLPGGKLPGGAASTYMTVERRIGSDKWEVVLDDAGWDTKYEWKRLGVSESRCVLQWKVGGTTDVQAGVYRMRYFGRHKTIITTSSHVGTTNDFTVVA